MELTEKERDRILLKWSKIEPKTKTKEEWEEYMIKKLDLLEKKRKIDEELNSI